jgi:hypothetical protein
MSNTTLYRAKFQGANLQNTVFTDADLHLADFSHANIEGAIFEGANVYAALFTDVRGVDNVQRKALEKRSARWYYDLFYGKYFPLLCFCCVLIGETTVVIFSIMGFRSKETKTRLFVWACYINGFVIPFTLCPFLIGGLAMFLGEWGDWLFALNGVLGFALFLLFCLAVGIGFPICVLVSFLFTLYSFVLLFRQRDGNRPWQLFFYLALTFAHCFCAFGLWGMFIPDK